MSGPIVRKYGFPNFENIFGDRPLQHGEDDAAAPEKTAKPKTKAEQPAKAKAPAGEAKKKAPRKK